MLPLFRPRLAALVWAALAACSIPASGADCIPFADAQKHIGSTRCVSGKVLRVETGKSGTHFFDFCEDYRRCPFTVVVFAGDLKRVGDVRQLAGKDIIIHGEIKSYDGRAEIILERPGQLRGDAARIPPLPKTYDVERRGHYSAGTFSRPGKPKKTKSKAAHSSGVPDRPDLLGDDPE